MTVVYDRKQSLIIERSSTSPSSPSLPSPSSPSLPSPSLPCVSVCFRELVPISLKTDTLVYPTFTEFLQYFISKAQVKSTEAYSLCYGSGSKNKCFNVLKKFVADTDRLVLPGNFYRACLIFDTYQSENID